MKKIISVVGARPNFMKVAPIHHEISRHIDTVKHIICHTGQHYDEKMSKFFFEDLQLPQPDYFLGVGAGSHAVQTANVMVKFEEVVDIEKPDLVLVVGDVNSTVACALVASKKGIPVAHVEAGLRSFDRGMPEEINRILTDSISDYLFVTEESGLRNLEKEGVNSSKVFFTGNVMIDSLIKNEAAIADSDILSRLKVEAGSYILVTLHRPSNVDDKESLERLIGLFNQYAPSFPIVFPVHPRTRGRLSEFNLMEKLHPSIILTDPIGYIDFLQLLRSSKFVVTDSGGIQEETTYLKVPCVTLRDNTERPVTVELGTNYLAGTDMKHVQRIINQVVQGESKKGEIPPLWDGRAAERICEVLVAI